MSKKKNLALRKGAPGSECRTYTVPFRLIRQSRVTVPCGPALILVHVTRHFDFGRMRKMVQKKALKSKSHALRLFTRPQTQQL